MNIAYHGALLDDKVKALWLERQVKHVRHHNIHACRKQGPKISTIMVAIGNVTSHKA